MDEERDDPLRIGDERTDGPPELPRMAERPLDREGADMLLRPTLRPPLLRGAAERMPLEPRETERPPEDPPPLPLT